MTEIEQLRHDIDKLKSVVRALAMKGAISIDESGDLVPASGPCIYEARDWNGNMPNFSGTGRAWCQIHGFDCPNMTR